MQRLLPFFDLKIDPEFLRSNEKVNCSKLIKHGFRTIAVNIHVQEIELISKKRSKNDTLIPDCSGFPNKFDELVILKRLTIEFKTIDFLNRIYQESKINEFDIIAVICSDKDVLKQAILNYAFDIISFNPFEKCTIKVKSFYEPLREKNIFLEIMYVPAIVSGSTRQNIISVAHCYHIFAKSRNIIITSGARNTFELRGPYDIISLALILGLNKQQAKDAISRTCRQLLIKAQSRRFDKISIIEDTKVLKILNNEKPKPSYNELMNIVSDDEHSSVVEIID